MKINRLHNTDSWTWMNGYEKHNPNSNQKLKIAISKTINNYIWNIQLLGIMSHARTIVNDEWDLPAMGANAVSAHTLDVDTSFRVYAASFFFIFWLWAFFQCFASLMAAVC